ncbi:hypothetical protein P43SY_002647 [Pythium insidiosum]|uniref:Helix-hairpin-helix DNA-binding motif class 1 domain-containing protein n=1 Tax=Pythium insidiosum TaxID=114742 RepID=A0AAD5MAA0_PYTIN|nr:hypothetical protein P43SY_002647 [Pythium insidiosum]
MLDLNSATIKQLQSLPGIGPVLAERIRDARPFSRVQDLRHVQGIGPKRYAALVDNNLVTVGSEQPNKLLPSCDAASRVVATRAAQPVLVDINLGSSKELTELNGVGPVLAQRIAEARPFFRKEEIRRVHGIGLVKYEQMKHQLAEVVVDSTDTHAREQPNHEEEDDVSSSGDTDETVDIESAALQDESAVTPPQSDVQWRQRSFVCRELVRNIRSNCFVDCQPHAELLDQITGILSEFDLVALQEVRDTIVLKRLKALMPGWDYTASPLVGSDQFSLVNVHLSCGDATTRQREVHELRRVVQEIEATLPRRRHLITLGDFNLAPQDMTVMAGHLTPLIRSPLTTTVFNKLHDNVWLGNRSAASLDSVDGGLRWSIESGVYRGALFRADGSARMSHGSSTVLVAVYGPGQAKSRRNEQIDRVTIDVCFKLEKGVLTSKEKEYEQIIRETFEPIIIAEDYPRAVISIVVQQATSFVTTATSNVNAGVLTSITSGLLSDEQYFACSEACQRASESVTAFMRIVHQKKYPVDTEASS